MIIVYTIGEIKKYIMERLTMKQAVFYKLLKNLQLKEDRYIPVFEFMGDVYSPELSIGGFVSHECSARLSEINTENPNLLQITKKKSKYSPNHYFCYRINPAFTIEQIQDTKLMELYKKLSYRHEPREAENEKTCPHGLPIFVNCPACNK